MDARSTAGIIVLIVLIIINAIISAAYAALVDSHKQQLREAADEGDVSARRVLDVAEDSTRLLTSRQFVGIVLRFLAAGILTLEIARPVVPPLESLGVSTSIAPLIVYPVAWILGAMIMMLFGELIPSAFASTRPEQLARLVAGPMALLLNVLSPVTRALLWFSNRTASTFGGRDSAPYVTEEEIKTLVDAGSEEGVIEDDEKEMIYSVFQFGDRVAREIMVPRMDIVSLDADTTLQEALDVVLKEGHSRIPVYEGSIDSVVGLLYAKDLLVAWRDNQHKDRKVREIIRPAYFVPESKSAGSLLQEIQKRKIHMAIAIDEYGGTAGIVTIEDLIEEIVGEIQDEYDSDEEAEYVKISDDEYLFDAAINLGDVEELMDVDLPDDESDTLGGYVLGVLGRFPQGGEVFQDSGLEIKVETITGHRIRKVRVKRLPPADAEKQSEAVVETKPQEAIADNSQAVPSDPTELSTKSN